MNKDILIQRIKKSSTAMANIDNMVENSANNLADTVNNEGVERQVNFLIDTCGCIPEYVAKALCI